MSDVNQTHYGPGDNVAGDKIINNAYYKSAEYKELTDRISELKEDIKEISNSDRRLIKQQKLTELTAQLEKFKEDVTRIYETFTKIEVNTEKLRLAKELFENGQIREADAILKAEELLDDQEKLLGELQKGEDKIRTTKEKLKNNANEFLVKAQTTAALFNQSDWFDKSADYYKRSIQSFEGLDNLFGFASFLLKNKVREAGTYFERCLSYAIAEEDKLTVNNSLGNFYSDIGENEKAEAAYIAAVNIARQLAKVDTQTWETFLASALSNLGGLYIQKSDIPKAEIYLKEAYQIRKRLFEADLMKHGNDFARILNNLGALCLSKSDFENAEKYILETLNIQERLAETNSEFYTPQIALSLVNLSVIYISKKDFNQAISFSLKGIEIQERLAKANPYLYLQELVDSYQKIAIFYKSDTQNEEKWLLKALEGLKLLGQINPQLKLPLLAEFQIFLGEQYSKKKDMDKAERMFLDEIDTYKNLANKYPSAFNPDVSYKLIKMSDFYYALNDVEKEGQALTEALTFTKPLAVSNPDQYEPDLATIYQNLAIILS